MDLRRIRRLLAQRLKELSSANVVILLAICACTITFLGMRQPRTTSAASHGTVVLTEGFGESSAVVASRSLTTAAKFHPVFAGPFSQLHSFLVLDSAESGSNILKKLEPYLAPYREYPEAVAITLISGVVATSLAAQFSITASGLPVVVYLPPAWHSGSSLERAATFSLGADAENAAGFTTWVKTQARMTLLMMNDWDNNDVCFYTVTPDDKEVEVGCMWAQAEMWQDVALLDTFTARNKTTKVLLARHIALFSGLFVVHPPDFCNYLANRSCDAAKLPPPTDQAVLHHRVVNEERRALELKEQPAKIKKYTTVGFEKVQGQDELYQALSGYLNSSWGHLAREIWPPDDTFTNHDDAPSMKMTLPRSGILKTRFITIARKLLEKWIGNKPLEETAVYGIRVYSTNSTLAMHCDRPDTHIISAIINVGQDVSEPWPLQILDHAGAAHDVNMQAGDVVMYEGASCAHGRPSPLKGRFFANVFVHFRPKQA